MRICFIGSCGHFDLAYEQMKQCKAASFVGIAPASVHEDMQVIEKYEMPVFDSYQRMIEETSPDIAVISPVFGLTGSIIRYCAERKIDIFAEKPVASTLEELEEVERIVKENNVHFSAMHFLRFTPSFYHAQRLVKEGAIGDVRLITAQKSYKYGVRPDWYSDRDLYTGTIPWVGIHAIDWIHYFCPKRFLSVKAVQYGSPEMVALCQFELEGNVFASANLDYLRPQAAMGHGDDRVRVVGTKGIVEVYEDRFVLMTDHAVEEIYPEKAPKLAYDFLLEQEEIAADEIFMLTRVALQARASADSHEVMDLE